MKDDAALTASRYVEDGKLVRLEAVAGVQVAGMTHGKALLMPVARDLVVRIGERLRARAAAEGLPAPTLTVTSAYRTLDAQAELDRANPHATAASAHLYGTTFDLGYLPHRFSVGGPSVAVWTRAHPVAARFFRVLHPTDGGLLRSWQDEVVRVLRPLLQEELMALRTAGELYFTTESDNCYHVSVRPAAPVRGSGAR